MVDQSGLDCIKNYGIKQTDWKLAYLILHDELENTDEMYFNNNCNEQLASG